MIIMASWFIILTIVSIILLVLYLYSHKNFNYWRTRGVPGPKPLPFIGNTSKLFQAKVQIGPWLQEFYKSYDSPYIGVYVLDTPVLLIKDPELLTQIFVKDFNSFADRTALNPSYNDFYKNAMFFQKHEDWKPMRNKIASVFSTGKLKYMLQNMKGKASNMVKRISKQEVVKDAKDICLRYSIDVEMKVFFDIDAGCLENDDAVFLEAGKKLYAPSIKSSFSKYAFYFKHHLAKMFKLEYLDKEVQDFFAETFRRAVDVRERINMQSFHFIDILRQIRKKNPDFNSAKMESTGMQFFAAGIETMALTTAFILYEFCMNPSKQTKARDELRQKLRNEADVTYEILKDLKYLNACVSESLRKYPIFPLADRRCTKDYQVPGTNLTIEKGTPIFIPLLGFHYDENYFPEPEKFKPERFLDGNRHLQSVYIPFGTGPRSCIGSRMAIMSIMLALVNILHYYEVEKIPQTPSSLEFAASNIALESTVGLPMRFKKSPLNDCKQRPPAEEIISSQNI